MPHALSACLGIWVPVGSRDEAGSEAGLSHFLEHLFFKGSRGRSALEIAEAFDRVGGDLNAFTTREMTCFYAKVPAQELAMAVEVICEMLSYPTFAEADVASERKVVIDEIAMQGDEPAEAAHQLFIESFYQGHPLGRDIAGYAETVSGFDSSAVRSYFESTYSRPQMVVSLAGSLDVQETPDLIVRHLSGVNPAATRRRRVGPTAPKESVRIHQERDCEQLNVVLGYEGLRHADERRFTMAVFDQIVGGTMSSRLFQKVREERGLAYSISSWLSSFDDSGVFGISCGTMPEYCDELLEVIDCELDDIKNNGVSDRELEIASGQVAGSFLMSLESSSARMTRLGKSMLAQEAVIPIQTVVDSLRAVNSQDISALAERVLSSPRVSVSVGPGKGVVG